MILNYSVAAQKLAERTNSSELALAANIARKLATEKPETFREALQLLWFAHISFQYEGRFAMALGRMDQYLYPYYCRDIQNQSITKEYATELVSCMLYKIGEKKLMNAPTMWGGDVVTFLRRAYFVEYKRVFVCYP